MANIDPVVDIDINNLFYQLHVTATKEVESTWKGIIDVVNLGVDYKNQTFVGAGDFIVVAQHSQNDNTLDPKSDPENFKKHCTNALERYIEVFAGAESAKNISNKLKPLNEPIEAHESIAHLKLSQLLMEDAPENDKKQALIGFYIDYSIAIEGQKKHRWYDMTKDFAKFLSKGTLSALTAAAKSGAAGMFGGVFKDLQSLKMNIGGKEYGIGEPIAKALKAVADGTKDAITIAGQKFVKVFGKTDLEDLNKNFDKAIHDEFPNSKATSHIYNVDSLLTKLRKEKKLDANVQQKLMKNGKILRMEHMIGLQVVKEDENYEQYSIDSLYRCFIDALNETKTFSALKGMPDLVQRLTSTFSKDDIIKIDGYKTSLGVNRLRRGAIAADSIDVKQLFMRTFLGSLVQLNEDMYDDIAAKIEDLLKDNSDNGQTFSQNKLKELAHAFSVMDPDKDYKQYKTEKYATPADIEKALRAVKSKSDLDEIIDAFADEGNIKTLYSLVNKKFGSESNNNISASEYELYLFCLSNVLRQKDEETKKKVKKD